MRLTLRTLLAYLDDVLDANHTREIGKKVQESKYASDLVERIKKVTRQRRLLAPDVEPGENHLDANQVAKYLDNTLSPAEINEVEKACLESDVQLAEVAASHQVLTLILGEPVDIPPDTRSRMYKIVPHAPRSADHAVGKPDPEMEKPFMEVTKSSGEFRLPPVPDSTTMGTALDDHEPSFREELPEYLRQQSSSRNKLGLIAVCVTLLVFVGLLIFDDQLWNYLFNPGRPETVVADADANREAGREAIADNRPNVDEELTEPAIETDAEPAVDETQGTDAAVADAEVETEEVLDTETADFNPSENSDTPAVAESEEMDLELAEITDPVESETDVVEEVMEDPAVPSEADSDTEVALATPPVPGQPVVEEPVVEEPVEPKAAPAPTIPPARVLYTMQEGVVIQYQPAKEDWFILPRRALIHPGETLASPLPFDATFDVEQGELSFKLIAGTRIVNLPASEAAPLGIDIERGQVLFTGGPKLTEEEQLPYPVAIMVGESTWRLELMTPETRFGIEAIPKQPYEIDPMNLEDIYNTTLYVQQGNVRFADGDGQVQVVNANEALSLELKALADNWPVIPLRGGEGSSEAALEYPDWMQLEEDRDSMTVRKAKLAHEKLFETDRSVGQSMSPHIINRNPIVASWAVDSLGHARDIHSLVQALTTPDQPLEVVKMAQRHLREWLVEDPDTNAEILQAELEAALAEEDRDAVTQLLWGITPGQAQDPAMSQQILAWMDHSLLAVRDMAFELAAHYTDRELHYRPDASEKNRQSMLLRWKSKLEKNGGRLVPVDQ
ncbi:MAG: hypothetical protein CMJ46_12805 [Planctomyces sp.]|nr:hypothetical protein [Planctomyces sp.]